MRYSIVAILCAFLFFTKTTTGQQSLELKIELKNYGNDTIILGNYFGDKQVVKDTLYSKDRKNFVWVEDSLVKPGMYMLLLKPSNQIAQFFIDGKDRKITMAVDMDNINDIRFKGSEMNSDFYKYLVYLKDLRPLADTLRKQITASETATGTKDAKLMNKLNELDLGVKELQTKFIEKHKGSLFALLLNSSREVEIPDFQGTEEEKKYKRFLYYKEHFFDFMDFHAEGMVRTPFISQKFDTYLSKLTNQDPDSLIRAIDFLLLKVKHDTESYRYFLASYLNKYGQMKIVGQDAIYVHLVDNYYAKGETPWVTQENINKMIENADELRPILIHKTMPDFTTYLQNGDGINLHSVKSEYTIVIFWAPDCGHCKKIMPSVVSFYENYKDKGVKIFSVCTKGGDKTTTCWPAIEEKKMQGFINTADEYQRYNAKVRIKSTPKIFILDTNKKILIKDISGEEIEKIFKEIYEFDHKTKEEVK
jgi:thiol-disulfide isomerase/thioredoxin